VYQGARSRVRQRTGELYRAITWEPRPRSVSAVVGVSPSAFHWKFLEYGTVNMEARPFFRPAAEAMRADHNARMIRALEKAAQKVEEAAG
jgi:HK97 gp10 family phage protein